MKLNIKGGRIQPDPYVIKHGNKYYMYASDMEEEGVQVYVSDNKTDWKFLGVAFKREGYKGYWAPCVLFYKNRFYMYLSVMPKGSSDQHDERLCVAVSDKPDKDFVFEKEIAKPFSIDPHVVESGGELFIFYSVNDYESERAGTYIVLDKMKSPTELCGQPKAVVKPSIDEEIFMKNRFKEGQHWHTIEGAFYFRQGDWHYIIYSGNCYQNEKYFLGYAVAKSKEKDLTKLIFKKYPNEKTYSPLLCKNEFEEGTGHNSVLLDKGIYYVYYHGRDYGTDPEKESRTARVCKLSVKDGVLSVYDR